jgi:hypothetical protein
MPDFETPQVSTELLNTVFIDRVFGGQVKEAQENASQYIRLKLYEDGILRRLFPFRTVPADELDPELDNDIPSIICEKEPSATTATFVPFKGTGDRRYFNGVRFRVPFGKVESERISKSRFELMTIKMAITDWLKENQVKAIQQEEDELFIDTCKDIVTKNAAAQDFTYSLASGDFKEAFLLGPKALTSLRLPVKDSIALMHKNTYLDSLKLKLDAVGFKGMDNRWDSGVEDEDSFFLGYKVVTTIKDDLVPEGVIWFFTSQEYFCKSYLLQDATLFLEVRADMLHFHTYEAPGFGVRDTHGVVRITLK